MHNVHALCTVAGVISHQDGAGVDGASFGNAHQEKAQHKNQHPSGKSHDQISGSIACCQEHHGFLGSDFRRQHAGSKTGQQITNTHKGQQCPCHAVCKAVGLLQHAYDHAAADGAYAA